MASGNIDEVFILQADGFLHASDVRCVRASLLESNAIFSASRDSTAKCITIPTSGDSLKDDLTFIGHKEFVNFAIPHLGIELLDNEPCLVTGSNDHHVILWNIETGAIEAVLDGHNVGVCCGAVLAFDPEHHDAKVAQSLRGDIVSGDWSGVLILFDHKSGRPKQLYDQHKTAIRGVAQLTNTSTIVSCSGDKTIHAWSAITGATIQIFSGHLDVVQCICALDSQRFASGSNDCSVRLWRLGSDAPYQVLNAHDSLVYSVCWSPQLSELYSASEDHTVRVWRSTTGTGTESLAVVQVIQHPCVVWSVTVTADGNIVTGGSDNSVRVWTRNYDHMASVEKLEMLEAAVSSQRVDIKVASGSGAAAASGGLNVEAMPYTHEIQHRRGMNEGERLFVRNEKGEVELYVWNTGRWEKIGVVVAGPEGQSYTGATNQQREKYTYNGESYDYLFDVDVEGRMLKLPYRIGDSLVETAKRFIQDYPGVVTQDAQEEIQNFLMAHVSQEDLQRVPGLGGVRVGASPTTPASPAMAAAAAASSPAPPAAAEAVLVPWAAPQVFDAFNPDAAQAKVNTLLDDNPAHAHTVEQLAVSPCDTAAACTSLIDLYSALPSGSRFPAVDALRYLIVSAAAANGAVVPTVLEALSTIWGGGVLPAQLPSSPPEWLVALRLGACVVARLCSSDRTSIVAPLSASAQTTLLWLTTQLPSMSNVLTKDTAATTRANCKAASSAIQRNVSVLLRQPATSTVLSTEHTGQLAMTVVRQSALLLVSERNDSPLVKECLQTLVTLLQSPSEATEKSVWRHAVVVQAAKSLTFSLRSIATGATVAGQSTAAWLLAELDAPLPS